MSDQRSQPSPKGELMSLYDAIDAARDHLDSERRFFVSLDEATVIRLLVQVVDAYDHQIDNEL